MRTLRSALLALLLVVGIGACGDDDDDGDTSSATTNPEDTGGDTVAVTISGSSFDPAELEAAGGDATFSITNDDSFAHTFTVDDLDIDQRVEGGETATVTASLESGTYDFHCNIHPSMTGTITVA